MDRHRPPRARARIRRSMSRARACGTQSLAARTQSSAGRRARVRAAHRRALGLGQRKGAGWQAGLPTRSRRACARSSGRDITGHVAAQQQFEMHLQCLSGVRSWCAALARNRCCIVLASRTSAEQPIERADDRRDFDRGGGAAQRDASRGPRRMSSVRSPSGCKPWEMPRSASVIAAPATSSVGISSAATISPTRRLRLCNVSPNCTT